MTEFYALKRHRKPEMDWGHFWLWTGLIVFGVVEAFFACWGFAHALVVFGKRLEGLL